MWAWMAALGVSRQVGIVSPAYAVYRPRTSTRFESRYLDYLLRTELYRAEYLRSSRGVTTSRLRLYPPDFLNIPFIQPPLDEQRLIARFLDWHGLQTTKLIRAKKKLIALLNEQKGAVIHRAVTRGLDPNVKLKPSGTPWLNDVPEGWVVKRLKNICQINPSKSEFKGRNSDELVTFLPMERVSSDGRIDCSHQQPISELANGFTFFRRDDVILAKITPCFENGKGAVLDDLPTEVGFGSTEFIVLRASRGLDPRFLYLLTCEPNFRHLGVESMTGSAGQQRVSSDFVANYVAAVPDRAEQSCIVEGLRVATSELDTAIGATSREIALIQELRSRLIHDVVTGGLDVRASAANLSEFQELYILEPADAEDLDEMVDDCESAETAA
jgi:type I restriction enzyme S subunit